MEIPAFVFIVPGVIAVCGVSISLAACFFLRNRLLPEEVGQEALETVLPLTLRFEGLHFTGPFSRVSVYPDFIAFRALGASRVIRQAHIQDVSLSKSEWIKLGYLQQDHRHEIRILTPECDRLLVAIKTLIAGRKL